MELQGTKTIRITAIILFAIFLLFICSAANALDLSTFNSLTGSTSTSNTNQNNNVIKTKASSPSSQSLILSSLMRYFDPAINPEPPKLLANWQPDDETRKQQVLRQLVSVASGLIQNYQSNGLSNVPTLPVNIPGVGALMRAPDKVYRAELSMLQDLIIMAQKMTQSPLTAMLDVPKDFAVLMSRMTDQIEQ